MGGQKAFDSYWFGKGRGECTAMDADCRWTPVVVLQSVQLHGLRCDATKGKVMPYLRGVHSGARQREMG